MRALLLVLVPAVAAADPDLQLHHDVLKLHMRPKVKVAQQASPPPDAASTSASATFEPLPHSVQDLKERVIVRVRAGYELESAPSSGQPYVGGMALPAAYSGSRPWVLGDAVVGARDLVLPSLGGYLLSSFQFDAGSTIASTTSLPVPGDATGQRIAIKAGYAEYGTEDKDPNAHVWLRAGRQYRLDAGAMFAYYDGATIGWKDKDWNASAFAGQRVALYVDTPAGTEYGATAMLDLQGLTGRPMQLKADVMALSIAGQVRSLIAVSENYDFRSFGGPHTEVIFRGVDNGTGLGLGSMFVRAKWALRRDLLVVGEAENRYASDVAYDLAAPSAIDVVQIAQKLGVGLAAPVGASFFGARVDYRRGQVELYGFGRAEIPQGTTHSVDQNGWLEAGAAVATPILGAWTTAQYTLRQYFLDDTSNMAGAAFADTSGSGLQRMHQLAVDTIWHPASEGGKRWRLGGGLFYRLYDVQTPYLTVSNDGRAGGRADVQYWMSRELHIEVAADVAQSDPVLQRQLGVMSSVRAAMEARW